MRIYRRRYIKSPDVAVGVCIEESTFIPEGEEDIDSSEPKLFTLDIYPEEQTALGLPTAQAEVFWYMTQNWMSDVDPETINSPYDGALRVGYSVLVGTQRDTELDILVANYFKNIEYLSAGQTDQQKRDFVVERVLLGNPEAQEVL